MIQFYCLPDKYYGIVPIIILFSAFIAFFPTVDPLHTVIDTQRRVNEWKPSDRTNRIGVIIQQREGIEKNRPSKMI